MTYIIHFYSLLMKISIMFKQNVQSYLDVWKDACSFRLSVNGFRCNDL